MLILLNIYLRCSDIKSIKGVGKNESGDSDGIAWSEKIFSDESNVTVK